LYGEKGGRGRQVIVIESETNTSERAKKESKSNKQDKKREASTSSKTDSCFRFPA
jgi:hypothetical protein